MERSPAMNILRFLRRRDSQVTLAANPALTEAVVKQLKRGLAASGKGFVDALIQLESFATSSHLPLSEDVRRSSVVRTQTAIPTCVNFRTPLPAIHSRCHTCFGRAMITRK
jgi:hypothetical protein